MFKAMFTGTLLAIAVLLLAGCRPVVRAASPTVAPTAPAPAPGVDASPSRSPAATQGQPATATRGPTATTPRPTAVGTQAAATPSPTRLPASTPAPGQPTATPVSGPFGASTPVRVGAGHPAVGGDCLALASKPAVAIVPQPPAERPLPAFQYVPAPARPAASSGKANLRPFDGGGLAGLLVHPQRGSTQPGTLDVSRTAYIDWSIRNAGSDEAPGTFVVDIYFDGVFVNRWQGLAMQAGGTAGIRDWEQLADFVRVTPGAHTVRLVIDPANAVAESDESDNIVERQYMWAGDAPAREATQKSPDLRFVPVEGSAERLVVSNHPGALKTAGVSAEFRTYLSWSIENIGLASTSQRVYIHLFFDGTYVTTRIADGITAGSRSSVSAWDGLQDEVAVKPGTHRLKLVVDPGDLIQEGNESDNVVEADIVWGSGTPAPQATTGKGTLSASRKAQSAPDLRPEVPSGWDGPLVVRGAQGAAGAAGDSGGREGHEAPAIAGASAFIDVAVANSSPVPTNTQFEATVVLDGATVETFRFRGGPADAGGFWTGSVEISASKLAPGTHRLELLIDPSRAVPESDESDNRCERTLEVVRADVPSPAPVRHSEDDLRTLARPLTGLLLRSDELGAETPESSVTFEAILSVAEAGYYNLLRTSLVDERLTVDLVPRSDYDRLTLEACLSRADGLSETEFRARLDECTTIREGESGLQTVWNGRVHVFVDTDQTPAGVLSTLFHELGHARQALTAPQPGNGMPPPAARALHEAQAQLFEAAMWRGLERLTGLDVDSYPGIQVMQEHLRQRLDTRIDGANEREEHDLGYVLLWLAALKDSGGLGVADELRSRGRLGADSALKLYESLLAITDAGAWANDLLSGAEPVVQEYIRISTGRLVSDLPPEREGHPDLKDAALVAP